MSEGFAVPFSAVDAAPVLEECRQLYLSRLSTLVEQAGVASLPAVQALHRGAGKFYDEMVAQRGRPGFESAHGLTASRITLVSDDDLELAIRLGEISRHLFDACEDKLYRVHLRFITILERPGMESGDNPVGPEGICCGLAELCQAAGGDLQGSLSLLKRIEAGLLRGLPLLYAEINELLARHGVHPAQRAGGVEGPATPGRGVAPARPGAAAEAADPLTALQSAVLGKQQPAALPAAQAAAFDPAAAALGMAMLDQLLGRLEQVSAGAAANVELFAAGTGAPGAQDLRALKSGELGGLLRGPEAAALEVLTLVFDAVFDDQRLPEAVKAAIGRLQMPLLKAALLDKTFFADREHPARVLIDNMARAALGVARDAGADHPVCARLQQVGAAVQSQFERDVEVLAGYAAELETFAAQRDQAIQARAEAYVPLALAGERQDLAVGRAAEAVAAAAGVDVPAVVGEFLRNDWARVLESVYVECGDGSEWGEYRAVVRDLIWSVRPKQDAEERKRLAGLVPGLLRLINQGLDRIGVSTEARKPFLDALFEMQTAGLRARPAAAPSPTVAPAVEAADAFRPPSRPAPGPAELVGREEGGLVLKSLRIRGATEVGYAAGRLRIGDWVEFVLPGGDVHCGRLCWTSPGQRMPLFFNPDWGYAVTLAPVVFAEQLGNGLASVRTTASLFDAAAEKALKRLSPVAGTA